MIDVQGVSLKLADDSNCILIATLSINTFLVWKKTDNEGNRISSINRFSRLCINDPCIFVSDEFSLLDSYDFPQIGVGVSGISFSILPHTQSLIMVCPKKFVDFAVYSGSLTFEKTSSKVFEEKLVVSGHSNWINDIATTTIGND